MAHFATHPHCAVYLATTSANLFLDLIEDREQTPSLTRRRCLCQIAEALSRVAGTETSPFCLDVFTEITTTKMRLIGDELIPTEGIQQTLEPIRWRMNIVQMCLQEDPVVSIGMGLI